LTLGGACGAIEWSLANADEASQYLDGQTTLWEHKEQKQMRAQTWYTRDCVPWE